MKYFKSISYFSEFLKYLRNQYSNSSYFANFLNAIRDIRRKHVEVAHLVDRRHILFSTRSVWCGVNRSAKVSQCILQKQIELAHVFSISRSQKITLLCTKVCCFKSQMTFWLLYFDCQSSLWFSLPFWLSSMSSFLFMTVHSRHFSTGDLESLLGEGALPLLCLDDIIQINSRFSNTLFPCRFLASVLTSSLCSSHPPPSMSCLSPLYFLPTFLNSYHYFTSFPLLYPF